MEDRTSIQAAALTPSGNLHHPMTQARKALFIKALRETGVFVAAARVASPHSDDGSNKGAASSFRYTMSVDPEFAAAVAEAKEEADASLEMECWRRAYEGVKTPVFQKGTQATDADGNPAFIVNYSDRLLERLLESRMPERWTPRKGVEMSGSVAHDHTGSVLHLSVDDVLALSPVDREELGRIMTRVAVNRGEIESTAIDVTPDPVALPVAAPELQEIK